MNDMGLRERVLRVALEAFMLAVCCAIFGHVVAWTAERFPGAWIGSVAGLWAFAFGSAAIWLRRKGLI